MRSERLVRFAVIASLCAACADDSTAPGSAPAVFVRLPGDSLFIGRTMRMIAAATGDSAAVAWPTFSWHSSDTTIAVIDSTGVVLALNPGTSVVRAEFNGHSDSITVRVVPQRADNGVSFTTASAGYFDHCAVSTAYRLYCRRPVTGDSVPKYTTLAGDDGLAFGQYYTSAIHSCGVTITRVLTCWGDNGQGQTGTGLTTPLTFKTAPSTGGGTMRFLEVAAGSNVTSVSTAPSDSGGTGHTCAINAADSVVYCVGANSSQQLGHAPAATLDSVLKPVTGNFKALHIASSKSFVCAIGLDAQVYCWGSPSVSVGPTGATPAMVSGGLHFSALTAGDSHVCALSVTGPAYCWGTNIFGQLGDASTVSKATPTAVATTTTFSMLAAGSNYTCGVSTTGDLFCWGAFPPLALSARLGAQVNSPVQLARGIHFRAVTTDRVHICGVTTASEIYCF